MTRLYMKEFIPKRNHINAGIATRVSQEQITKPDMKEFTPKRNHTNANIGTITGFTLSIKWQDYMYTLMNLYLINASIEKRKSQMIIVQRPDTKELMYTKEKRQCQYCSKNFSDPTCKCKKKWEFIPKRNVHQCQYWNKFLRSRCEDCTGKNSYQRKTISMPVYTCVNATTVSQIMDTRVYIVCSEAGAQILSKQNHIK